MTKHLTPAVRIQKARTALLLDHPFFGSLLFRLAGRASGSIQTMATDGVSLFYNPAFVETLNAAELAGVPTKSCTRHFSITGVAETVIENAGLWHATMPSILYSSLLDSRCQRVF